MKKKPILKFKKYAYGTPISGEFDLPNYSLMKDKAYADAKYRAMTDPVSLGIGAMGQLASIGGNIALNQAAGGLLPGVPMGSTGQIQADNMKSWSNMITPFAQGLGAMRGTQTFAYGGQMPIPPEGGMPAEIEGGEVGQMPSGNMFEAQGPSHEAGGMPVQLPPGTEMYSKRIKIDGVSMADRKKKREKKSITLEKLLEMKQTDAILKNTQGRQTAVNAAEEAFDEQLQMSIAQMLNPQQQQQQQQQPIMPQGTNQMMPGNPQGQIPPELLQQMMMQQQGGGMPPEMPQFAYGGQIPPKIKPYVPFVSRDQPINKTGLGLSNLYNNNMVEPEVPMQRDIVPQDNNSFRPSFSISEYNPENPTQGYRYDYLNKTSMPRGFADGYRYDFINKKPIPRSIDDDYKFDYIGNQNKSRTPLFANVFDDVYTPYEKGFTVGDAVGAAGDLVSTFGPMTNTLRNRMGDTPNINPYANFGERGLRTIEDSKNYIAGLEANKMRDLELARYSAQRQSRNNARGVNEMRALDLAADMNINKGRRDIRDSYSTQMMNILGAEAKAQDQQDQMRMQGLTAQDMNDRRDRDNYYTNMAQNISTMGKGVQTLGSRLNLNKSRRDDLTMIGIFKDAGLKVSDIRGALSAWKNMSVDMQNQVSQILKNPNTSEAEKKVQIEQLLGKPLNNIKE